jgi:hypothetical protein
MSSSSKHPQHTEMKPLLALGIFITGPYWLMMHIGSRPWFSTTDKATLTRSNAAAVFAVCLGLSAEDLSLSIRGQDDVALPHSTWPLWVYFGILWGLVALALSKERANHIMDALARTGLLAKAILIGAGCLVYVAAIADFLGKRPT